MRDITLRIDHADGRTEQRRFAPGRYSVGREVGDVVLADPGVSSRHAEIEVQPDRVIVTDSGSTNGTFDARGQRVRSPLLLAANQSVRLGNSKLTLVPAGAAPTAPMPVTASAGGEPRASPDVSLEYRYRANPITMLLASGFCAVLAAVMTSAVMDNRRGLSLNGIRLSMEVATGVYWCVAVITGFSAVLCAALLVASLARWLSIRLTPTDLFVLKNAFAAGQTRVPLCEITEPY